MATDRPCPSSAVVHCGRTGQRSHTSASNSMTVPNEKRCTWPWGHSIVRSRRLSLKADFGEQAAIVRLPGFAHDFPAPAEHVVHEGAVDIAAIDQEMIDVESLPGDVHRQGGHRLLLGAIRGRDGA